MWVVDWWPGPPIYHPHNDLRSATGAEEPRRDGLKSYYNDNEWDLRKVIIWMSYCLPWFYIEIYGLFLY